MTPVDIGYHEYKATSNLYAVHICICPYTKEPDITAVIDPLFDNRGFIIHCDEVIFSTEVPTPEMPLSQFPDYAIITTEEEVVSDVLMGGLADAKIFDVGCSPVRIGPRYPYPQVPLLSFLALRLDDDVHNPDDVVLPLWEECPRHRHKQRQLVRILQYPLLEVDIVI